LAGSITGGGSGSLLVAGLPFTTKTGGVYVNNTGSSTTAYMYGITLSGTYGRFFAINGDTSMLFVSYNNSGSQFLDSITIVGASDIVSALVIYIAA
jgi:hypothetical protein